MTRGVGRLHLVGSLESRIPDQTEVASAAVRVLVLGAGVVGVASAWFLRQSGHDVVVVDRQPGPALETSYANGGQISASHAEPWANADTPGKVLRWLGRADAPLRYRPQADALQWRWVLAFLRECTTGRAATNVRVILPLALHSRRVLKRLRQQLALDYDCEQRGILHIYTDPQELAAAQATAALMRTLGCERRPLTAREAVAIEPALADIEHRLAGADYCAEDESGDAHRFTRELARHCAERGVEFRYGTAVLSLLGRDGRVNGARLRQGAGAAYDEPAAATVVCLGVGSGALLRPWGLRPLIYPAKGYSVTFEVIDAARAPRVSLTDDEYKLVFSRLGQRLRVAGTVEIAGWNLTIDPARSAALVRRTAELFPAACDYDAPVHWTGLRPLTPANIPYLGPTRVAGLYLNAGHGSLGWTLAAGSGELLAQAVSGEPLALALPAGRL